MGEHKSEEFLSKYPDLYADVLVKEVEREHTIKGISLKVKFFDSQNKKKGIRVSLLENTSELFVKFLEVLSKTPRDDWEKAINMWSFASLAKGDHELPHVFGKVGFFVYSNHLVFMQEKDAQAPLERLETFISYYKKKFGLKTYICNGMIDELERLEVQ